VNFFFGPMRIYLEVMWTKFDEFANRAAVEESKRSMGIEAANTDPNPRGRLPFLARLVVSSAFLLIWPFFYQRAIFLIIAFLGYYFTPIWYSLQMLQIATKFPELQNIIRSITKPWKALVLTGILMLVVFFMFAIAAYYYLSEYINRDAGYGEEGTCSTLRRCLLQISIPALRANGGIGDNLAPPVPVAENQAQRWSFDLTYFVIFEVLFLKLVFGIILDTFGELRETRDEITQDQQSQCFICGLDQSDFDRVPNGGFSNHIENEHQMWYYLYFMHYCKLKPSEDHTGPEGFVHACMQNHEPDFYPIGDAMCLEAMRRGHRRRERLDHDENSAQDQQSAITTEVDPQGEGFASPPRSRAQLPATLPNGSTVRQSLQSVNESFMRIENLMLKVAQKRGIKLQIPK